MSTELVRSRFSAAKPLDWYSKESATYLAPDGRANVVASSEPLEPSTDSRSYAAAQGELLQDEFPDYVEHAFGPSLVFGERAGFIRRFSWHPQDAEPVTQIQLYYAEGGRGYTATATALVEDFAEFHEGLTALLDSLRI